MEVPALRSIVARGTASSANAIYQVLRRWFVWVMRAGPIPNHVAIIMDGNRRYADRRQMEKTSGHQFGYETLIRILRDCYDLGVKCVSVYAFSIQNFKRSKEEVATLMNLMQEKLEALIEKESMVTQYGIRVQIVGELSLLPERVRRAAEKAMAMSQGNDKVVLNIFAPYTSTHEIVKAVENVCNEAVSRRIHEVHVKYGFGNINGSDGQNDDDAVRSSDTSFTLLCVTPVMWPEFSFRHLLKVILDYQKAYPLIQHKKRQLKRLISLNA